MMTRVIPDMPSTCVENGAGDLGPEQRIDVGAGGRGTAENRLSAGRENADAQKTQRLESRAGSASSLSRRREKEHCDPFPLSLSPPSPCLTSLRLHRVTVRTYRSKITHRMLRAPLDTSDCAIASFSARTRARHACSEACARVIIVVVVDVVVVVIAAVRVVAGTTIIIIVVVVVDWSPSRRRVVVVVVVARERS